jgi:hypothetical protein
MQTQGHRIHVLVRQIKRGFAIALAMGLALLATALVPRAKGLGAVNRTEVRPAHPRNAFHSVQIVARGKLSVVNFVHRAVSVRGLAADQAFRLIAALAFLAVYSVRVRSSSRLVRGGLAVFALLGAAGCLSDFASYATLSGVVDWIGVDGRSAFAPSDLCWAVAPAGMFLTAMLGVTTFYPARRADRWRTAAQSPGAAVTAVRKAA